MDHGREQAASVDDREAPVVLTRGEVDDLLATVGALQARVADLEAAAASSAPATSPAHPIVEPVGRGIGRRAAIAGLAGAALGGAAALTGSQPAAAANGANIVLGSTAQDMSSPTGVAMIGTNRSYGFGITDNGLNAVDGTNAVLGHAKGQAFYTGVRGQGANGATGVSATATETGIGLFAGADAGIALLATGTTGPAGRLTRFLGSGAAVEVSGEGPSTLGLKVSGKRGQVLLDPLAVPPAITTDYDNTGTLWQEEVTVGGTTISNLWVCVANGSPGTWRKLASTQAAGALHVLPTPVRVYDSRPGTNPSQGPKTPLAAGNVARTIDVTVNSSGVPVGATAALITVLLVNATAGNGNFTLWAGGKPRPASNTYVWGGSAGRFTTQALTAVDAAAKVQVSASIATDVVLDVVGWYR